MMINRDAVRGFTLLEVMLVLVIMGLAVSFVMLNAVGTNHSDDLKKQVQRFQVVFDMASDYAVLNQQQLGLYIDQDKQQYAYMLLDEDQKWQWLEGDKVFASHALPEPFQVSVSLDDLPWIEEESLFDDALFDEEMSLDDDRVEIGKEEDKPLPPPQVLILSSGEFTPFSVTFTFEPQFGNDAPVYFRLLGKDYPPLELEGPLDSLL